MKKIVIFGAGDTGYTALRDYGTEKVIAFADNFKQGEFCGLPIWDMDTLKERARGIKIVVASAMYEDEIAVSLTTNGFYDFELYRKWVYNKENADNEKLAAFHGKHKNQSCFIIGNGPSLRMEDLEMLHKSGVNCIAANKIYLCFDKVSWRPDYFIAIDRRFIGQYGKEIASLPLEHRFVATRDERSFWDSEFCNGVLGIDIIDELYTDTMPSFSDDICKGIFEGCTVTYAAMQLASYMGYTNIYLLGVDFDYSKDMLSGQNYFTSNYMRPGEVFNNANLSRCLFAYQKAEKYSREQGFRIYNATRGGKLEVFERVDFDSLFNNKEVTDLHQ
jgi:hypothetical protein